MIFSAAGALVFIALLLIGRLTGGAIIVGLFASLAFGSTAIVAIPALGNSSPLIYTIFALLLIAKAALEQNFAKGLLVILSRHVTAVVACVLAVYALASAIILPRLFANELSAFIAIEGTVLEVRLAPSGGNITQTAYLIVGIAAMLSLRMILFNYNNVKILRSGFFAYVIANILLGLVDLGGKVAGLGDWLLPIRTADYALLTDVEATGFWRIVGGCSEASSFAISCLACVAFAFMYWRRSGSMLALILTIALLFLLIFSTSSTAYVGLAVVAIFAATSMAVTFLTGGLKSQDLLILVMPFFVFGACLAAYLYNPHLYDPFVELIQTMVLEKSHSSSAEERFYWNEVSLRSFLETYGLGIGMGSSRSSSWIVSVLSQLGLFGALLFGALIAGIFHDTGKTRVSGQNEIHALISGARGMAVGWVTGICVAGSSADPGPLFFLILAAVLGCKSHLRVYHRRPVQVSAVRTALMET